MIWVHDLSPFLWQITDSFGIRWYGLAYLMGFVAAAYSMKIMSQRSNDVLKEEHIADFITALVLGTMIGGRFGYAIFYSPDLLTSFSGPFPYWGVLRVWEGGMASHGGMLGVAAACWWFAWKNKLNWLHLGDLSMIGASVGIFLGRIANFINGELYGRVIEQNPPAWAVKFPSEILTWTRADSPYRDKIIELAQAAQAISINRETWIELSNQVKSGFVSSKLSAALDHIVYATQNANHEVVKALEPVLNARHPSQLYEALLEGLLMFVITIWLFRKPRVPGIVCSVWIMCYSVVRIIGEQFRMPDAHIGFGIFGLTRGQLLSLGMLVFALILLTLSLRQKTKAIGGWGKK